MSDKEDKDTKNKKIKEKDSKDKARKIEKREMWKERVDDFIYFHLGFILTIFITYIVGIMLIAVQYFAIKDKSTDFLKLCIDSIVPTTITYVLGCVIVNIIELFRSKADKFAYNLTTCIVVCLYIILFAMYLMIGYSVKWAVIEFIATLFLIYLNFKCYIEKFNHRNHKLA